MDETDLPLFTGDLNTVITKGKSTQDQIRLWDSLLQIRNHLHKIVHESNSLSEGNFDTLCRSGDKIEETEGDSVVWEDSQKAIESLHNNLLELQDTLKKVSNQNTHDVADPVQKWLHIQKLRSKLKRKVDTRASKGRRIRFDVHPKLVNFMASYDHCPMTDSAIKELYSSLFGNQREQT